MTTTNKQSGKAFKSLVSGMIKEAISDKINSMMPMMKAFENVKDKQGMGAWIGRVYAKYLPSKGMQPNEILDFVVKNPNALPITPMKLADMYKKAGQIRGGLGAIPTDEKDADAGKSETGVYQSGEETLANIGKEMGDLTPPAVKKLGDRAQEKITNMLDFDPRDGDIDAEEDFQDKFENFVDTAAEKYTEVLRASGGDIDSVFNLLQKVGILQVGEADLLSDAERVAVQHLADLAVEGKTDVVQRLLKKDIDKEDNIVKSFQNTVAAMAVPPARRGRPPGAKNKPKD